jgi:hypothetical protein
VIADLLQTAWLVSCRSNAEHKAERLFSRENRPYDAPVTSVRGAPQQMTIAFARYPFGPSEMTVVGAAGAFRLSLRVDMKNDPSHLVPIGIIGLCVEHAQISGNVLVIVSGQRFFSWREIGDVWIRWMGWHDDYSESQSNHRLDASSVASSTIMKVAC